MRYVANCLVGLALCASIIPRAKAQGCRLDMTPYYSVYASESTDGTNVYTSVLSDGYANFQPSAGCSGQGITHQPRAYNLIHTTGGWGYGTASCVSCYLSYTNSQEVPLDADGGYGDYPPFVWEGEIFCSVAGDFFDQFSGTPPNDCDFTIAPEATTVSCGNGSENSTTYVARVSPSIGQCSYNALQSSCSWKVVSGDVDYSSNDDTLLDYAECTANYFAGPVGTWKSGQEIGVIEFDMTLVMNRAKIEHTQTATVSCK